MNSLIDETTKFRYITQIIQRFYVLYKCIHLISLKRVSSVLNKDNKSYGKQFLCDGKEETCWNSDQVCYLYL